MSDRRKGRYDSLNKRIIENPRYKHIKAVVDSGSSMLKYMEQLEETQRNYKFKKDEIFRRLKLSTFSQLVLQVTTVAMEEEEDELPSLSPYPSPPSTARSTLSGLVSGVGELDISLSPSHTLTPSSTHSSPDKTDTVCPYLLLDVRDSEAYKKCHIVSAHNYPASMLSRSCNPFTREMYYYRNRTGFIIVLYDEDESIAPQVATKLVQRDFDNIFMLSGGMKVLYRTFPNGFLTGVIPLSCLPSPPSSASGRKRLSLKQTTTAVSDAVLKESFSSTDLLRIQMRLDEVLLNGSSRGSSMASVTSSRLSTISMSSSLKPWK